MLNRLFLDVRSYFQALLKDRDTPLDSSLWVGLNFKGRVMGSDFGTPIWDELLAPRST